MKCLIFIISLYIIGCGATNGTNSAALPVVPPNNGSPVVGTPTPTPTPGPTPTPSPTATPSATPSPTPSVDLQCSQNGGPGTGYGAECTGSNLGSNIVSLNFGILKPAGTQIVSLTVTNGLEEQNCEPTNLFVNGCTCITFTVQNLSTHQLIGPETNCGDGVNTSTDWFEKLP